MKMVEIAQAPQTAGKKFACRKCRKVLFTDAELQEHSSKVKDFKPRDNKVREKTSAGFFC